MKKPVVLASILLGTVVCASAAVAAEPDNWIVKVGVHEVDPKSNNGTLAGGTLAADVSSNVRPTITGEYLFTPNWGVELLASLPWQHDVKLNGAKAATVKQLPPTISAQYHFNPDGTVSPFVGVGLNATLFFSEHTTGPLAGTRLSLSDSFGPALHAGLDFHFDRRRLFSLDARWMKIDPSVKVNGSKVGTVHIDPIAYGVSIGYRF